MRTKEDPPDGKTLAGENYSQPMLIRLPSGNSLGETLASKKYPKSKLVQQLSRHSIGETLANEKYPWQKSARLPYGNSLSNNLARNKLPRHLKWELLTKPIEIKSIFMRFTQTSGSSLDKLKSVKINLNQSPHDYPMEILLRKTLARLVQLPSRNSLRKILAYTKYPLPYLLQLPFGNFLKQNLASEKYPQPGSLYNNLPEIF
ncbi:hypothetical protein U3516DRAFT_752402 [Neocallimastix sp. 'constans']